MKYIIFDFDTALTSEVTDEWQEICKTLRSSRLMEQSYRKLVDMRSGNQITYERWVEYLNSLLVALKFNRSDLEFAAWNTKLVKGGHETLAQLSHEGYHMCIMSNGIKEFIEIVLGDNAQYFDEIRANEMWFGKDGRLIYTKPFLYDLESKVKYIEKLKREHNIKGSDIIFISNANNNELVEKTNCRVLRVNTQQKRIKHNAKLQDLRKMLPRVKLYSKELIQ